MASITARERRYRSAIRAAHHTTWFLAPRFPNAFPLRMVMGYPKSGNTWVAQQIADCLQLPLPSHSITPLGFAAVAQSHYAPSRRRHKGVYVLRDGRDVMVSLYYYLSWDIPSGLNPPMSRNHKRWFPGLRDKADIRRNLPAFIERQMNSPVGAMGLHWARHVEAFFEHKNPSLGLVRYERLLEEPVDELRRAIETLEGCVIDLSRLEATVKKFSFEQQSGRPRGAQSTSSFLRAGRKNDWKKHFTTEAADVFARHCGVTLIAAGYESDHSWTTHCGTAELAA